jgi:hypothetical protein
LKSRVSGSGFPGLIADLFAIVTTLQKEAARLAKDADRLHKKIGRLHGVPARVHKSIEQTRDRIHIYRFCNETSKVLAHSPRFDTN